MKNKDEEIAIESDQPFRALEIIPHPDIGWLLITKKALNPPSTLYQVFDERGFDEIYITLTEVKKENQFNIECMIFEELITKLKAHPHK